MEQLSKAEFRRLLQAARAHSVRDWLIILVGYYHALRVSELTEFRRDAIKDGHLTIQRKKGSEKTTQPLFSSSDPLLDERKALVEWALKTPFNQPLFNISTRTVQRMVKRHAKTAGIPEHKAITRILKQTCGRQMADEKPLHYVQRYLGHKSLKSTGAYTRVNDEEASAAACAVLGR